MPLVRWVQTTPERTWSMKSIGSLPAVADTLELTGERCQTIDGFGGCFNELGWIALGKIPAAERAKVLNALFGAEGEMRFTCCRLPVGANDYAAEWYSYDESPGDYSLEHFSIERDRGYLIPYVREALQRQPGMTLFSSPWSPPTWMKFPRVYNYGTMIWEKNVLDAYARYFLKYVQAYAGEGITVRQIHIQNEPVADQKFPSCLWTGEQLREFIAGYIGPLFAKELPETEIWLGTINSPDYDLFANLVLSDPRAARHVRGVSYQWAGKHALQQTTMSYPELRCMQSENECGDGANTWEYARYIFNLFRHYLTNGVNAYVYWNMVLEPGGRSTWGWPQNALITIDPVTQQVTYNPEFYVMKHFSHFVQPGAKRRGLRGHLAGNAVAFENPDGSTVTVVGNDLPKARRVTIKLNGEDFTAELQPYSFNTFVRG